MWIQIDEQEFEKGGADYIRARIEHYRELEGDPAPRYRAAAEEKHGRDGEREVDDDAVVSVSDDGGAYVMGWLWVYDDEAGIEREDEDDGETEDEEVEGLA